MPTTTTTPSSPSPTTASTVCSPTPPRRRCLPVLALAERDNRPGLDLLTAYQIAVEVETKTRRSDQPAALRRRFPFHGDFRRDRRRRRSGTAARAGPRADRAGAEPRRHPGCGPARELRHHDQALSPGPFGGIRRRRRGTDQARLDRGVQCYRSKTRLLQRRRRRLRPGSDPRQARQTLDLRHARRVDQAASQRIADPPRHGRDARTDPRPRHPSVAGRRVSRSAPTATCPTR